MDERHHGPVPSYAAFVQSGARTRPVIIQLGEAAGIEREISRWLETVTALPGPDREALGVAERDARAAGGAVRAAVWDPLAGAVDGAERVFVVPDGALHLVNLAALPAGEAGYMVETGPTIHYLAAERDLIGAEETRTSLGGLLIIGDPDFDAAANATPPAEELRGEEREKPGGFTPEGAGRQTRSGCAYFRDMRFGRLPETAREAKEITELLSRETEPDETEVMLLTGAGASEAAFKRNAPGRRIIHLATHGFFLGGRCPTVDPNGRGIGGLGPADHTNTSATGAENPLLLSGLVFAGANRRDGATSAEEDGILTAEEIAAVDLGGVEWAVLSACDTGMGEIKAGEGIFGLRRAFQVAGAGTLIISLWGVEDRATADWMRELYAGRIAGLSTADAVRRASLAILSRRRDAGLGTHPFYWGAFVASGKWR